MKDKYKSKIIISISGAVIGAVCTYFEGKSNGAQQQNEYIMSKIVNIDGDNNTVVFNDIDDFIDNYVQVVKDNNKLNEQNTQYFDENRELKEKNEKLISQSANKDDYNFSSVGLSIDGEKIAFDNLDSVLTFNGKEYWSKELATKLVPDNKSVSRKDDCIYVGNIVAEASNLFDMHINDSSTAWLKDMATDSYGNAHSNVLISYNCSSGHATFVLNKKYKYIKFSIAASDSCEDGASMNYVIKADDNVVYTSKSFTKKDEPFSESSIDISNCNLLTVEFNTDKWGEGQAFMYDAVVFNAE